jgi:tRNA G18 (ribose-2'-O)-methylase SpoU
MGLGPDAPPLHRARLAPLDVILVRHAEAVAPGTRGFDEDERPLSEAGQAAAVELADELEPPCVYLHALSDPGNVGAVIRSADALVGGTVVLGPACADPHSPKAVRASMGSIFSQPVARAKLTDTPPPRAALIADGGAPLQRLDGAKTVCLGAERQGLPEELLAQVAERVTIPLRPGVDSLNVAAAAAIALQRISSPAVTAEVAND